MFADVVVSHAFVETARAPAQEQGPAVKRPSICRTPSSESTISTASSTTSLSSWFSSRSLYKAKQPSPQQSSLQVPRNGGLITFPSLANDDISTLLSQTPDDLTWYYNYESTPTSFLAANVPHVQFVPMLWGSDGADGFASSIRDQLDSGANINHILSFNEPDICDDGGSCIGSPAVTGSPGGFNWLEEWFASCEGACKPDFVSVHWYGDFQGFASQIGQSNSTYVKNVTGGMWVTEFADPNQNLTQSQSFYNSSTQYLDRLLYVDRYAYFGAFRSSASSLGPDVAMLDHEGQLTDVGSWYLGGAATGRVPQASRASRAAELPDLKLVMLCTIASPILALASVAL